MKKLTLFVGIAIVVVSAKAEYLWWTVNQNQNSSLDAVESWVEQGNSWDTANLYRYDSISKDGTMVGKTLVDSTSAMSVSGPVATWDSQVDISSLSSGNYSYYIELVNSQTSKVVGYTDTSTSIKYEDFGGSITTTLDTIPTVAVWHGGSYKATPEPTSAVLMLLGVAGLALRRKQRNLA